MPTDAEQVQELLVALIPRLINPRCLQGLLEMHLEPKQIHVVQVQLCLHTHRKPKRNPTFRADAGAFDIR